MESVGKKFNDAIWHLMVTSSSGSPSVATGFLFEVKVPSSANKSVGYRRIYLVSNRHVLYDFPLTNANGTPLVDQHNNLITHRAAQLTVAQTYTTKQWNNLIKNLQNRVHTHDNPDVDLAVVDITEEITLLKQQYPNFAIKPLTSSVLANAADWRRMTQETPCSCVGYLQPYLNMNTPENEDGKLSIDAKENYGNLPQVKLHATIPQGASGSPAFVSINGTPKLFGIIAESIIMRATFNIQMPHWAIAIKTTALVELLNKLHPQGWK